jgi:hypothetical protein
LDGSRVIAEEKIQQEDGRLELWNCWYEFLFTSNEHINKNEQ